MAILAYRYPVYQPAMRIVSSITNSNPVVVVTTFAHQYKPGAIVRINIPSGFGMQEINQKYAPITILSATSFSMPIDTTTFSVFVAATAYPDNRQSATVTPVGEVSPLLTSAVKNVLPYSAT